MCLIKTFQCSGGETIYVYEGKLSDCDIKVKYTRDGSRKRTPKHIHWTVDLLLKKQRNYKLTIDFIKYLDNIWKDIKPFRSKKERQKMKLNFQKYPNEFDKLNKYGHYSIEFLVLLIELLAIQEKTNRNDAYMFGEILEKLQNSDDLFSIISKTTYNGK